MFISSARICKTASIYSTVLMSKPSPKTIPPAVVAGGLSGDLATAGGGRRARTG